MATKFIFLDPTTNEELLLPVTPPSFSIDHGINSEQIKLNELGTINLPGKRYMMNIKINCLFPASQYPFCNEGAVIEPMYYVQKFEAWCDRQTILRFMIDGTNVNTTCYIESIEFSQNGGNGDITATLVIAQYRVLKATATATASTTQNNARADETEAKVDELSYTIVAGDTLSGICRKFYGDAGYYSKLAVYNSISNANLIYAGTTIKIPDKSKL